MLSLEVYEDSDIPLQNAINFRRNILKEKTIRSLEATAYFRYYMIYKNYANSDTVCIHCKTYVRKTYLIFYNFQIIFLVNSYKKPYSCNEKDMG